MRLGGRPLLTWGTEATRRADGPAFGPARPPVRNARQLQAAAPALALPRAAHLSTGAAGAGYGRGEQAASVSASASAWPTTKPLLYLPYFLAGYGRYRGYRVWIAVGNGDSAAPSGTRTARVSVSAYPPVACRRSRGHHAGAGTAAALAPKPQARTALGRWLDPAFRARDASGPRKRYPGRRWSGTPRYRAVRFWGRGCHMLRHQGRGCFAPFSVICRMRPTS